MMRVAQATTSTGSSFKDVSRSLITSPYMVHDGSRYSCAAAHSTRSRIAISLYSDIMYRQAKCETEVGMTGYTKRRLSSAAMDMVAERFKVLSEPMRLRLLYSLMDGEKNVSE